MYAFLADHFGLNANGTHGPAVNTTEVDYEPLPCRTLTVTSTGRVMDAPEIRSLSRSRSSSSDTPDAVPRTAHDLLLDR